MLFSFLSSAKTKKIYQIYFDLLFSGYSKKLQNQG